MMSVVTFKGSAVNIDGSMPSVGSKAPEFSLVQTDLSELSLSSLIGKKVILNIFPSSDTGVCAASVRRFNKDVAGIDNVVVLSISKDLPFAHARFCTTEGIVNVKALSVFRCTNFEKNYGLLMTDGPLKGLLARAVVVIDEKGNVVYTELVPEITQEPNYDGALAAIK
ncbi:lipid hydroperoxide peroxidase [Bacteroidales bacterium]|nr:lipid hydroperoxide peroxidase [Bacteroidales bacterium]